jgi:hypothetical protein
MHLFCFCRSEGCRFIEAGLTNGYKVANSILTNVLVYCL